MADISPKQVKFITALAAIGYHAGKRGIKVAKWVYRTKPGRATGFSVGGGLIGVHLANKAHLGLRRLSAGYQDPRRSHER